MKPFYASALLLFAVCSLWVANDTPYTSQQSHAPSYGISFGSLGGLHR